MKTNQFEQHSDYSLFLPGKSWIFVNPSHGCPLDCSYCVEKKDKWFEKKITAIYSPEETIERMIKSQIIVKDKSPLTFYNFSDPFLAENKENLLIILKKLDSLGWKNKIGLITKMHPGINYLESLKDLRNLKIAIFVSYANLIPGLEKVSSESRIKLMEDSKNLGIKTINYARPLVSIWTDEKRLNDLGDQLKGKVDAISLSSVRLTPEIISSLKSKNISVPEVRTYVNKNRETPFFHKVTEILREKTGVPVFWHTSCAMCYVWGEPDYNSHDIRDKMREGECLFPCSEEQRKICYARKGNSSDEEIRGVLKRLGKKVDFRRENETIFLSGDNLTKEDISIVRHLLPEFVQKDDKENNFFRGK